MCRAGAPARLPLILILLLPLPVVERTLVSLAFDFGVDFAGVERALLPAALELTIRIRVCLQAYRKADTTVEQRRLSAA